jgi:hypothetical protein
MVHLKRLAPALACALVLSGTAALAQTNTAYRSTDVVAGKPHRLGVYGNVQKDCTSGPLPTVRVVTPPKHGELNVRSGKLKAGRISRCPKLEASTSPIQPTREPTRSATRSSRPVARWRATPSGSR